LTTASQSSQRKGILCYFRSKWAQRE
jgi:hypothetical protein